jgi:hypothetical protein
VVGDLAPAPAEQDDEVEAGRRDLDERHDRLAALEKRPSQLGGAAQDPGLPAAGARGGGEVTGADAA